MITARDLIDGSLRLLGVLGDGEAASAFQAGNSLTALTELLDAWNADGLKLYGTTLRSLTLTTSSTYTMGTGGNVDVTPRPSHIIAAWIRTTTGDDYPLALVDDL